MKGYPFQCSGLENSSPRGGRVGSDWATFTFPWFLNGAGSWPWSWSCLLWVSWRPPEWCRLHKAPVLAYVEIQLPENKHQMEGFRGRVPFTTHRHFPVLTHTYLYPCVCVWIIKSQKSSFLWESTLSVVLRMGMDHYSAEQNFTEVPSALNTSYWLESMCYICLVSNLVNLKQLGAILPKYLN